MLTIVVPQMQLLPENCMAYLSLFSAIYLLSNYEWVIVPQCQIHCHEVLQDEFSEKDSQIP